MPDEPAFDERGLIPAVVQDADRGTVLMVAWMNAEALARTRATGLAHFWSRSRQALWQKGETSGNTLAVEEIRLDCDADTLLVRARPSGPACHTGNTACFYRVLAPTATTDDGVPAARRDGTVMDRLASVIEARRASTAERSYTRALLEAGLPKILAKIDEEHRELAAELPDGEAEAIVHETADLLFHLLVGLAARNVAIDRVWAELERRTQQSGHAEKASRPA
jgi:phosphoribosyl-ATP pyrophosphohydrolase/phosphoribosyl-AMP cyclohydrolase